jgi:hypothetical protein
MSENRKFDLIPASKIHASSVLPQRKHGSEVADSVRSVGVQQPLIVRPLPDNSGEFELIDGSARLSCLKDDELVPAEIRFDVTKSSDVFRLSETTFRREGRTAFETSTFYFQWMEAIRAETGLQTGLQTVLAQAAGLSEGAIAQYLSIARVFKKLAEQAPTEEFSALKNQSMAKLYKISEIIENPALLETVRQMEGKPEVLLEEVAMIVDQVKLAASESQVNPNETQTNQTALMTTENQIDNSRDWTRSAKKIESLLAETNQTLTSIANEAANNSERFSTNEALRLFGKIISTLGRLKRYSTALHDVVQPKTADNTVQTT